MAPDSVNHRLPSGPVVMAKGKLGAGGTKIENSVIIPLVVMRPILLPKYSVNHSAPSGPCVMPVTPAGFCCQVGNANSVIVPEVVRRTILLPTPVNPSPNSVNHSAPSGPVVMY